jgi:hypothetical protein
MSQRKALSSLSADINALLCLQDVLAAEWVPQSFTLDEVDTTAEQVGELVPHRDHVPKTPRCLVVEGDKDIDIARGTKIIP